MSEDVALRADAFHDRGSVRNNIATAAGVETTARRAGRLAVVVTLGGDELGQSLCVRLQLLLGLSGQALGQLGREVVLGGNKVALKLIVLGLQCIDGGVDVLLGLGARQALLSLTKLGAQASVLAPQLLHVRAREVVLLPVLLGVLRGLAALLLRVVASSLLAPLVTLLLRLVGLVLVSHSNASWAKVCHATWAFLRLARSAACALRMCLCHISQSESSSFSRPSGMLRPFRQSFHICDSSRFCANAGSVRYVAMS